MKLKKIFSKRGFKAIYNCILGLICYILAKFFRKKDIWLISERYNEARDNGYHLFKHINDNHSDIIVFYAIDKKSSDYKKISKYKNVIQFSSLKHHIIYWRATRLISTHINGYMPNEKSYVLLEKILRSKAKKVFLQHGIIKDLMPQLFFEKTKLDLFICGARPEYEYIKQKYKYPNENVKYLGLCRYDNLFEYETKKQILLMPTFRMDYFVYADDKLTCDKLENFSNSEYYKSYYGLLTDKRLNDELSKQGIELIFYPHYEMQKYLSLFNNMPSNIKIAKKDEYDVQKLLKESKLLITDFSSVFFDFAYMKKPIIYFQFDYESYRKIHYNEGYFFYEKDGFGNVVKSKDLVVDKILEYIRNDFNMEKEYRVKTKEFFEYHDKENCERNFNAIKSLKI